MAADKSLLDREIGELSEEDIIHAWNGVASRPSREILFFDETLRDGIQSPSVVDPPIGKKLELLHLMDELGLHYADVGLPGAGARAVEHVHAIVKEIRDAKLSIKPSCAARTMAVDIQPVVDISQDLGVEIEVMAFIGSSMIRLYAEQWDLDNMLRLSAEAIELSRRYDLPCCYVTEDTTRSHPEVLRRLFENAVEHGAHRLCLCDTVGYATSDGVRALIGWTVELLDELGARDTVSIDWHGHNDRGLALSNTLAAAQAGAERVHGTALGIGERVGNTAIDQVLLNMKLLGWIDNDLSKLVTYGQRAAEATKVSIPVNYPLIGRDAFRTATGVHAAAVIKAERRGDSFLADRIYSGVPAGLFGKAQEIDIGHMSGISNVEYWLGSRGVEATEELVHRIFNQAKASSRLLSDDEIWQVIHEYRRETNQQPSQQ